MNAPADLRTTARTVDVGSIHSNVTPEILEITIDKLKIVLLENEHALSSSNEWHAPLGMILAIALVFCTAEFRSFLGVGAETWLAVFIFFGALSAGWLIKALVKRVRRMTIDELIDCMKRQRRTGGG